MIERSIGSYLNGCRSTRILDQRVEREASTSIKTQVLQTVRINQNLVFVVRQEGIATKNTKIFMDC